jgi:RimJ/RimL family protein N-acetyltransferase
LKSGDVGISALGLSARLVGSAVQLHSLKDFRLCGLLPHSRFLLTSHKTSQCAKMRENEATELRGERAVLRPYRRECVPHYHGWMEDEELRSQTGSERLTLEEEFAMQEEWHRDPLKCTFIVYDRERLEALGALEDGRHEDAAMVGDINLFFLPKEGEEVVRSAAAEISVMVAEKWARGRGLGAETVGLMMVYAADVLGCRQVTAKISDDNEASLLLFRRFGFGDERHIAAFEEVHLHYTIDDASLAALRSRTPPSFVRALGRPADGDASRGAEGAGAGEAE